MASKKHQGMSSEKLYRLLAENMEDVVWTLDENLQFTYISPSIQKLRGLTPEEAMAQSVEETLTPESLVLVMTDMAKVTQASPEDLKNGMARLEVEQYRKDGSTVWVEIVVRTMFDDESRHIGYVGLSRDISQRRRAEQALKDSEAKYRTVFERANDAIFLVRDYLVVDANPRVNEIFGLKTSRIIGQTPDQFSPPYQVGGLSSAEAAREKMDVALAGRSQIFEWVHRRADGTDFAAEVGLTRLDLPEGPHLLGVVRDISQRKQSEESLRHSEAFVSSILRAAPNGMGLIKDRTLKWVSPRFCQMLGYEHDELINKSVQTLYETEEEFARVGREKYKEIARSGLGEIETRLVTKNGQVRDFHIRSALMNPKDPMAGTIFTATDITDRIASEAERDRLQAQLLQSQKLEAIGTLAGGIAHDFNNILAAIIGYAELTLGEMSTESRSAGFQEQILKAADRARQLISKIISFSRPRRMERRPIRLSPVIEEALGLLRPSAPSTIEIALNLPKEEDDLALADPSQVHQLIMNLATNALQAMEQGGRLEVSLESVELTEADLAAQPDLKPGQYLRLKVSDTGIGMSRATADRVFEPFFSRRGSGRGSGMGLAVVHGLVKGHEGAIGLDSALGLGTTFTVLLPKISGRGAEIISTETKPRTQGRERILLVDDEEAIIDVGQRALSKLGYRVQTFSLPQKALSWVREDPARIDLVITDFTMPGLTGTELARELKSVGYGGPIMICTGFNKRLDEAEAQRSGICRMLMKPLSGAKLAGHIREVLDQ